MLVLASTLACLALFFAPQSDDGRSSEPSLPPDTLQAPPMILERLGDHRRPVATESEVARRWFDQGMALMLGYNFDGAIASFYEATRHDPNFAMAWWGIAYAAGPNQNNPEIIPPKDEWSYAAAQRAYELRDRETGANRALIEPRETLGGSIRVGFTMKRGDQGDPGRWLRHLRGHRG